MLAALVALAEPNRLRIVELLRAGPRCVGEIETELHLRQPQVSKHLRVLKEAGLVDANQDAQRRFYELRPERFQEFEAWLNTYRRYWEERLDALEKHLKTMQAAEDKEQQEQPK